MTDFTEKATIMVTNCVGKPTITYNERRPAVDNMLVNDQTPPTYDEKLPVLEPTKQPVVDDKELAPSTLNPSLTRILTFHHAAFPWRSVNITSPGSTQKSTYHAEISEATPKKPDILLRSPGREGAGVGRAHFRLARSMQMGVGPSEHDGCDAGGGEAGIQWTEFKTSGVLTKGWFDFEWQGKWYRLCRTRAREYGVGGVQRGNWNHFKVVEIGPHRGADLKYGADPASEGVEGGDNDGESDPGQRTGEKPVAVYVSETFHPYRMKGTLMLRGDVEAGGPLERLIVMGVVGWREKMRRRAAYSGAGGYGGG